MKLYGIKIKQIMNLNIVVISSARYNVSIQIESNRLAKMHTYTSLI